jgi:predicted nuclease of predicted toxin-antitoxin system
MLRYHLDENVDLAVAVGLRSRGIDVTTTDEVNLKGASDERQIAFALQNTRVVVTHDDDLLVFHAKGIKHAGIAFCTLRTRTIGQLVLKLTSLSRHFNDLDIAGKVEFL